MVLLLTLGPVAVLHLAQDVHPGGASVVPPQSVVAEHAAAVREAVRLVGGPVGVGEGSAAVRAVERRQDSSAPEAQPGGELDVGFGGVGAATLLGGARRGQVGAHRQSGAVLGRLRVVQHIAGEFPALAGAVGETSCEARGQQSQTTINQAWGARGFTVTESSKPPGEHGTALSQNIKHLWRSWLPPSHKTQKGNKTPAEEF